LTFNPESSRLLNMKLKLSDVTDKSYVTITNLPWGDDDDGKMKFESSGRLEKDDEGFGHFVRIKEDGDGVSGVTFFDKHILEIEQLASGRIVIVIKS